MGNNTPTNSTEQFPLVPALILFVAFGFGLVLFLGNVPRHAPQVRPTATLPATEVVVAPTHAHEEEVASNVAYDPANVRAGETLFMGTCSACHGMNARGVPGLGKDLLDSVFVDGLTDEELHNFIVVGRTAFDPLNTTGITMPALGGNPSLNDQNLYDIIAFLRVNAVNPERIAGGGQPAPAPTEAVPVEVTESPDATEEAPYVLPIDRFGLNTNATPTPAPTATTYVLPIDRFNLNPTPTPTHDH